MRCTDVCRTCQRVLALFLYVGEANRQRTQNYWFYVYDIPAPFQNKVLVTKSMSTLLCQVPGISNTFRLQNTRQSSKLGSWPLQPPLVATWMSRTVMASTLSPARKFALSSSSSRTCLRTGCRVCPSLCLVGVLGDTVPWSDGGSGHNCGVSENPCPRLFRAPNRLDLLVQLWNTLRWYYASQHP